MNGMQTNDLESNRHRIRMNVECIMNEQRMKNENELPRNNKNKCTPMKK